MVNDSTLSNWKVLMCLVQIESLVEIRFEAIIGSSSLIWPSSQGDVMRFALILR